MAVAFQSAGAVTWGSGDTTAETAAPSGVVSGDLLILTLHVELGGTPTTPSGWTAVRAGQDYWYSTGVIYTYWREADGTSTDTPTVTLSSSGGNWQTCIIRLDGADTTTPIDTSIGFEDASSPISYSTQTVTNNDSLAVHIGATYIAETGTYSATNSFTLRAENASGDEGFWIYTKAVNNGDNTASDVTNTSTLIRAGGVGVIIAPSAGGGTSTITPTGLSSEEAVGSATITTGAVSVAPGSIASAEAFGSATISSNYDITPSGISTAEVIGSAVLTTGAVTLQPTGLSSEEAIGSATVATDATQLQPSGISSAEELGTAVLSLGAVSVLPAGISTAEAIGAAVLSSSVVLLPVSIASLEALGSPTLIVGNVTLLPAGIASSEAIGAAVIGDIIVVGEIALVQDIVSNLSRDIAGDING